MNPIILCLVLLASFSSQANWQTYLDTKKSLYVWDYFNSNNFLKFVLEHHFYRVYIFCGSVDGDYDKLVNGNLRKGGDVEAREIIQTLINNGVEVEIALYLNDDPNDFSGSYKFREVAKGLARLRRHLPFKAVHFDMEPGNPRVYPELIRAYETVREFVPVSAIIRPGWLYQRMADLRQYFDPGYYQRFADCETLVDAIMKVSDFSDLMAYDRRYSTVERFLRDYDRIRQRHRGHIAKPCLELDPKIVEEGLAAEFKRDNNRFYEFLNKVSRQFDGVTIHHYKDWYFDLYCYYPSLTSEYSRGEARRC
jgi:hypothetical protein